MRMYLKDVDQAASACCYFHNFDSEITMPEPSAMLLFYSLSVMFRDIQLMLGGIVCKVVGHRWLYSCYSSGDTATESFECVRCGYSTEHTLY